ncbi:peptidase C60, sortase A and B [Amycolatopsis mediterranei S699]|uniref:Peptidase C60, sortase A and B n=2 Tax=Amycolatopsis mediterranei TaxID=33910 RepID=A0A0H3CUN8_AMYMU|nr:class F sortase [Amycolatopsis mediterranei]ADJ41993.1 peptidase C60, sortase A and B [Amycolatopsis mediterranei U32]AEK38666.1 peptidase C60, sortase A and B [Amycolatopsis mediterranei S699]AFO73704.1 peptidase C60, sortase A and B [Amycolatopsis mediterranei S699]AGT80833.1 peptidase C60, sortase A and B [Amycolatopsis mediterranei RB]KDO08825.1 peptidase C60 [Amycolatopsis mediterranei]
MRHPRLWPAVAAVAAAFGVVLAVALVLVLSPKAPQEIAPPSPAATNPAGTASLAHPSPTAADGLPAAKPASLTIPAIGVRAEEIKDLGLTPEGALEVPGDATTVGWFTGAPSPGEAGPAVLAAHVDYKHVPGAFSRLKELRPGEQAKVGRADGRVAVFTVYRVDHYPKATFPTDQVYGDTPDPELRLITCGGAFDRASGNYLDNVVAYARLTAVEA